MNTMPLNEKIMTENERDKLAMADQANNSISLQYGQVYALGDNKFAVTTMDESCWLPLAASCMVRPAVGDTVLFTNSAGQNYILAVLQRQNNNASAQLNLPANTNIKVNSLGVNADILHTHGHASVSVWDSQTTVSKNHQQFSKNIKIQADNRHTKITGHDELHANSKRIVIAKDWRVRAQDTDIKAKRQASIDGDQVRLG